LTFDKFSLLNMNNNKVVPLLELREYVKNL
jgi:hypothetical protein